MNIDRRIAKLEAASPPPFAFRLIHQRVGETVSDAELAPRTPGETVFVIQYVRAGTA